MPFPRRRRGSSLAGRLGRVVLCAVLVGLGIGALLDLRRATNDYVAANRAVLNGVARAFAGASARAVAARDPAGAYETLRTFDPDSGIVYTAAEAPDGTLIAEAGVAIRLADDLDLEAGTDVSALALIGGATLKVTAPIRDGGVEVGRIMLVRATGDLPGRLLDTVAGSGIAALCAIVVGLVISRSLNRSVTRPLVALTRTMADVRESHDYGRAVAVTTHDEVGVLATTFNSLLHDIRERDDRLARHRDHLEQEVRDRTFDLVEAKDAAESANAAKSDFLATMSHEIRTPMNGMLVMAELLAAAELPSRQRRYAEVIARSGQSLLAIINDILDFAKVESGKLELEMMAVDPREVVDTVVTLFGERARAKGLDLAGLVAPEVPVTIQGDPVRLGQVLGNLVNNALKFAETGHVLLRVDVADGAMRFAVSDTGIGIPEEKLGSIFTAFSQADGSTTRRFGGTGLGLSIAQRLVAAMGGTIGVTSRVGEGSTFTVTVPTDLATIDVPVRAAEVAPEVAVAVDGSATELALVAGLADAGFRPDSAQPVHWVGDAAALVAFGRRPVGGRVMVLAAMGDPSGARALELGLADALLRRPLVQSEWGPTLAALAEGRSLPSGEAPPSTTSDDLPRFPGLRVLVADDSAVNREVAAEALARCGVTDVATVEDGNGAVEAVRTRRFDLVLMDGSMPGLDGFDATRAIRSREAAEGLERLPVVALTAHVVGTAADAWREAGMDGVLHKPFTLARLAEVLGSLSAPQGVATEASSPNVTDAPAKPEPTEAEAPLLDANTLDGLAAMAQRGGTDFLGRLLELYRGQAPTALTALREAAASGDASAIARAAHGLKSMSLNIGAARVAGRLAPLESEARAGGPAPDDQALAEIEAALAATLVALAERFDAPAPPLAVGA